MRVPRQWSGADLKKALAVLGYEETRQTGSHIRMTTRMRGEHHVTVPNHKVLPLGTLRSILKDVARHFECTPDEILSRLLGPG
jgi:predicted RNA binding protein YcfA (HicA-like mRNA interferase family)